MEHSWERSPAWWRSSSASSPSKGPTPRSARSATLSESSSMIKGLIFAASLVCLALPARRAHFGAGERLESAPARGESVQPSTGDSLTVVLLGTGVGPAGQPAAIRSKHLGQGGRRALPFRLRPWRNHATHAGGSADRLDKPIVPDTPAFRPRDTDSRPRPDWLASPAERSPLRSGGQMVRAT